MGSVPPTSGAGPALSTVVPGRLVGDLQAKKEKKREQPGKKWNADGFALMMENNQSLLTLHAVNDCSEKCFLLFLPYTADLVLILAAVSPCVRGGDRRH